MEKANLGLATTRELLQELKARGEVTYADTPEGEGLVVATGDFLEGFPEEMLNYRTVD